jgi:hypothetical protein
MIQLLSTIHKRIALFGLIFLATACETNFVNPNAPTDEQILNSREGLINLGLGIKQLYSTSGMRWLIETPAITAREGGITTTFQNMIELEDGGSDLPNFNSNVSGLWATMLRVMVMCDDVIDNVDGVEMSDDTRNSLFATASTFKAMAIGALAQHYEQVVIQPRGDNNANFVSQQAGYEEAVRLLESAESALGGSVDATIQSSILGGMELLNTIYAMQARFNLFAGNNQAAIDAAQQVDRSVASVFEYDVLNQNPIWARVYLNNAPNFKPRDNFGLPADEFTYDPNDGRLDFYLIPLDETNQNGLPIEDLAGFFLGNVDPIPVYLPGEMDLIIAEAQARGGNLQAAADALDEVRTKTSEQDPFGIGAGLTAYSGPQTADALLLDIYQNRRAELFLTGMSLEDSRRFGRPEPSGQAMQFDEERNRNFYPFPIRERSNNPNTPPDPTI